MIVDLHTHVWKHPGHLSDEFVCEVAPGRDQGRLDPGNWQVDLGDHLLAAAAVDRSVVSAMRSRHMGVDVPNQYVADYVTSRPEKLIGFAAVDPADADAPAELEECVRELGMQGLSLSPAYQNFHPTHTRALAVYAKAAELKIPLLLHLGSVYAHSVPLRFSQPLLVEDIAQEFPDLKIVVAQLGYPWTADTVLLVRKHPNVFTEVSGLANKPWQLYNALVLATEYRVTEKLLFGSDWPFGTPARMIEALYSINVLPKGTNFPAIPRDVLRGIVERPALDVLGLKDPAPPVEPPLADARIVSSNEPRQG